MTATPFPLGRVQEHDPLSFNFPAEGTTKPLVDVEHKRVAPIYDQGNLGSCTGNACAGALMTEPLWQEGWDFDEAEAVQLYSAATHFDHQKGMYPPDDTGSSGLAVAKAAKKAGFITSYSHAFGLAHTLQALQLKPVLLGIPWYDSMFEPDSNGVVSIAKNSDVAGGHEICAVGYNGEKGLVKFANSWASDWGAHGFGFLHLTDLERLLHEGGDATVLVK